MEQDLLAEFILRSRDFAELTRGKQLIQQAAIALQDIFGVDSGFFVYQKQLVLAGPNSPRVFEPWGAFSGCTSQLQAFFTLHHAKVLAFFIRAHDKWMDAKELPVELQSEFRSKGILQVGVFAMRSIGKVNGCIVLGRRKPVFQQDEDMLSACATQIALMLDMMKIWRLAETNGKKYKSLIENNPDAIFEMDLDGNVIAVNQAMEKITGYSEKELLAFKRGALIVPEDLERVMYHEKKVLEGYPQTYEVTIIHKSGHHKYVSMNRVPIQVEGMTIGLFAIAKDITEKRLAEELLRKSEKLAVVGQLAAGVAHEIRNPLTSLKGFVQLMSENDNNAAYCEIMQSELDRINEIVNEFLMIAKPQVRKFVQEDISALVQDVVNLTRLQGVMNNVQILVQYDPNIPLVFSDRDQLKQVFLNILKNAIDAMPCGGEIRVSVMCKNMNQVVIRFKDNGCGIPKDRIIRLGEPFYTTKEKGTGLGLMVSYKILEAHQGRIEIQSEVGKGTTVDVILPC